MYCTSTQLLTLLVHARTRTRTLTHSHTHTLTHTHTHTHTLTHTLARTHTHTHTHTHSHSHSHSHSHTHTHSHALAHSHTHSRTHTLAHSTHTLAYSRTHSHTRTLAHTRTRTQTSVGSNGDNCDNGNGAAVKPTHVHFYSTDDDSDDDGNGVASVPAPAPASASASAPAQEEMRVRGMAPSGHCGFESVADQLAGGSVLNGSSHTNDKHTHVRLRAVAVIRKAIAIASEDELKTLLDLWKNNKGNEELLDSATEQDILSDLKQHNEDMVKAADNADSCGSNGWCTLLELVAIGYLYNVDVVLRTRGTVTKRLQNGYYYAYQAQRSTPYSVMTTMGCGVLKRAADEVRTQEDEDFKSAGTKGICVVKTPNHYDSYVSGRYVSVDMAMLLIQKLMS